MKLPVARFEAGAGVRAMSFLFCLRSLRLAPPHSTCEAEAVFLCSQWFAVAIGCEP